MDLSLQGGGPFFVRAVLPNLPNPPGYGSVYHHALEHVEVFIVYNNKSYHDSVCTLCYSYHSYNVVIVTNWNSIIINGSWRGDTAGGCRNFPSFTDNPQYLVELNEDADGDGKCSVLIALMQKHRRQQKKLGVRDLCIGYAVYKVM